MKLILKSEKRLILDCCDTEKKDAGTSTHMMDERKTQEIRGVIG